MTARLGRPRLHLRAAGSTNDRARERWTAAGLPVLTLHEARHTCASMMIAANVNLKAVSVYMATRTSA